MRIKCPWCGDRPREEFSYYGDATVEHPAGGADDDFGAELLVQTLETRCEIDRIANQGIG